MYLTATVALRNADRSGAEDDYDADPFSDLAYQVLDESLYAMLLFYCSNPSYYGFNTKDQSLV